MNERPILFADAMVRAILEGRKTQTRRLVKRENAPDPGYAWAECLCREIDPSDTPCVRCGARFGESPFGAPGDVLWVREAWAVGKCADGFSPAMLNAPTWLRDNGGCWYRADEQGPVHAISPRGRWRPSIHMPRWASRLTLRVTSVRVERLQEITEEDARAEGAELARIQDARTPTRGPIVDGFANLWDSLAPEGSRWTDSPWVWVVSFERVKEATQ